MSDTLYMTLTDNIDPSKKLNTTYVSVNKWTSYQFCTWPKFQLSQEKYLLCNIIQGSVQLGQFLGQHCGYGAERCAFNRLGAERCGHQ